MVKKNLSKTEEIDLIEKLCNGNGYFAEKFGNDWITMESNIKNDFPIELKTQFNKAEDEVKDLRNEKICLSSDLEITKKNFSELNHAYSDLSDKRLQTLSHMLSVKHLKDSLTPELFFSDDEILTSKIKAGIGLSDEEKEKVVSLIKSK